MNARPPAVRRNLAAAVVALLVLAVAFPPSASAQTDVAGTSNAPTARSTKSQQDDEDPATDDDGVLERTLERAAPSPPSPDDVFRAPGEAAEVVEERGVELIEAQQALEEAERAALLAALAAAEASDVADGAVRRRDSRSSALGRERGLLSDLVVRAFVNGGDDALRSTQAVLEGDTTDESGGAVILFEQVVANQQKKVEEAERQLAAAKTRLAKARAARDEADAEAARTEAVRGQRAQARDAARSAHEAAIAEHEATIARLKTAPRGGEVPLDIPLIGLPVLTGEDLASWYASSPYPTPKIDTPIDQIAEWFIEEGAKEGIRGDIAFAQAVLETGGFTNTDSYRANNYSGIGHCDSCPSGWVFPSPQLGVRAQIQLLKSYAVTRPEYTEPLVDRRLRGPAGCCPTWGQLTTVWATDPGYGPKVMSIYSSMVDHALARRAAGLGIDADEPVG